MRAVRIAELSGEPLDIARHLDAVVDDASGAETSFVGRVRDHDPDASGAVTALEYTSHPDAQEKLRELADRAAAAHGAVVAVSHRVGTLRVGEAAVVIACSAAHREEAFSACRAVIEDIKRELPVWKRQLAADGTAAWKGLGG